MSSQYETDNAYVAELKSLLKDKFFMLLLGISVAIVILSTFYSFIRPKSPDQGELTQVAVSTESTPAAMITGSTATNSSLTLDGDPALVDSVAQEAQGGIAGLEDESSTLSVDTNEASFLDKVKGIFGSRESTDTPKTLEAKSEDLPTAMTKGSVSEYTVLAGDSLWSIAQSVYGSGYTYVDIARANSLTNPDAIEPGMKLKMPEVSRTQVGEITSQAAMTKSDVSIASSYTVSQGDNLWDIAQAQYNDPYQWTKIATLNNLATPSIINPGQMLKLK